MKKNGEWSDEEEGGAPGQEDEEEKMAHEAGLGDDPNDRDDEDENGRARDMVDQPGDDLMFEQFLKSGDYAIGGLPKKRARTGMENPEDEEEFAFKDIGSGGVGDPEKRAKTETQFKDFMKFLEE